MFLYTRIKRGIATTERQKATSNVESSCRTILTNTTITVNATCARNISIGPESNLILCPVSILKFLRVLENLVVPLNVLLQAK